MVSLVVVWAEEDRESKSLRGVFPFRHLQQHNDDHHTHENHNPHDPSYNTHHSHENHDHHADSHQNHQPPITDQYYTSGIAPVIPFLPSRESRQGGNRDGFGDDITIDLGSVAAAGERCIDKVVMVVETRYDDVIECKHSYSEKCHTTYVTDFQPQQEEECEENFVKSCFIEYKNIASEETVKFCHTPLECVGEGPEECKTVYESECQTTYHEHDVVDDVVNCYTVLDEKCEDVTQGYSTDRKCTKWPIQKCDNVEKKSVKKYSPDTNCKKVPRELCGPSGCELSPGPEFCFDKRETVVQEVITHIDYNLLLLMNLLLSHLFNFGKIKMEIVDNNATFFLLGP